MFSRHGLLENKVADVQAPFEQCLRDQLLNGQHPVRGLGLSTNEIGERVLQGERRDSRGRDRLGLDGLLDVLGQFRIVKRVRFGDFAVAVQLHGSVTKTLPYPADSANLSTAMWW